MDEFASIYNKFDKQCSYYSRHTGHLKALIDNNDWMRVVGRSMSGRVLLMGNSEIINALVMFNTRMFDHGADTITIHKLSRNLPTEQEIERHHLERMKETGIDYPVNRYLLAREQFINDNRELKKNITA